VADLTGSAGGTGSGVLTVPVQSRVYVTASASLANNNVTEPSRALCRAVRSSAGSSALLFDVGDSVAANLHQADIDSTADGINYIALAVTASGLVDAGTYDIGIVCNKTGTGTALINSAAVNVIAVPASG
jgi:hypothetical protein